MFGGTVKPNLDGEVTHCVCYVIGPCTNVTFNEILSRYSRPRIATAILDPLFSCSERCVYGFLESVL